MQSLSTRLTSRSEERKEKDEDDLFCELLATQLRQLNPRDKLLIKMQINTTIYNQLMKPPMSASLCHEQAANSFSKEIGGHSGHLCNQQNNFMTQQEFLHQFKSNFIFQMQRKLRQGRLIGNFMYQVQRKSRQGHLIGNLMFQMQKKLREGYNFHLDTFFIVKLTCS